MASAEENRLFKIAKRRFNDGAIAFIEQLGLAIIPVSIFGEVVVSLLHLAFRQPILWLLYLGCH